MIVLTLNFSALLFAESDLPSYSRVPEFTFTEQSGNVMTLSDLKGNVWIADFIFTRCQGMCRMITGRMATLQEHLAGSNVKLVSFSVDPEYDTPEVLSEYAMKYGAKPETWLFLTGEKEAMWKLITEGFSLGVAQATPEDLQAGAEPVMHSSRFVLVDQEGTIRGYYDSAEPLKVEELVQDALRLISSL